MQFKSLYVCRFLYFTDVIDNSISRLSLADGNVESVVTSDLETPHALALDSGSESYKSFIASVSTLALFKVTDGQVVRADVSVT